LFNAYAKAINKAYDRTGSLFEHPFGSVEISNLSQLVNLVAYMHFNPQKHGFVDDFRHWPYSSYGELKFEDSTWLQRDEVSDWFGGRDQCEEYHHDYQAFHEIKHLVMDDTYPRP
jgi:hypothetical protein